MGERTAEEMVAESHETLRTAGSEVADPNAPPGALAIFDLDGTLVARDTFLPFLLTFSLRARRRRPLLPLPFVLSAYACRLMPDYAAKQRLLTGFLGGLHEDVVREHAEWFCNNWLPRRLHPIGLRHLREHQRAGHRIILLSASPDVYVPAVGRWLGIEETVCTRVCFEDGKCLGTLQGKNCKGASKLDLLKQHLGVLQPPPESYAYGDSPHDLPVLSWVHNGRLIRRNGTAPVPRVA